jgi:hypothetical protein
MMAWLATRQGGIISAVTFASFGAPEGVCGAFELSARNPACHAPASVGVLEQLCLGKPSCELTADAATFLLPPARYPDGGDSQSYGGGGEGGISSFKAASCAGVLDGPGASARLWAQVQCSAPPLLQLEVQVPLASVATVHLRAPSEDTDENEGIYATASLPDPRRRRRRSNRDRGVDERDGRAWLQSVVVTEHESGDVIFAQGQAMNASTTAAVAMDRAGRQIIQVTLGSGTTTLSARF